MKRFSQPFGVLAATVVMMGGAGSATAQVPHFPLVPIGSGIYRPAVPTEVLMPPRAFVARVGGSFTLTEAEEVEVSEQVTRNRYTADNVAITFVPANVHGDSLRLVGSVTVVTTTTVDEEGNGDITGTLTFTSQSRNGIVAQLITASLDGAYGANAGPLAVTGSLNIPVTTAYERSVRANISATLVSNANLMSTLTGLAEVVIQ